MRKENAGSATADGRMVFISRTMGADVWSLPIDADRGRVQGALKRVTEDAADDYDPTLSADGATLVYRSRSGPVVSGGEPRRDEGRVLVSSERQDARLRRAAGAGAPQQVCDDCSEVEQWSPDGGGILYVRADDPSGVGFLKVGSPKNDRWLKHPRYGIYNPRFSPDGGWVAFNARADRLAPARVFVASVQDSVVAGESAWIAVTEDGDAPGWSPWGASLLLVRSGRLAVPALPQAEGCRGGTCTWARRISRLSGTGLCSTWGSTPATSG